MKTSNSVFLFCGLVLFLFWGHPAYANNTVSDSLAQQTVTVAPALRQFDQEALADYKEDSAFDYSSEMAAGPSWFGIFLFWLLSQLAEILGEENAAWLMDNLFKLVVILIVIFGVVLIIRMRYGPLMIGTGEKGGPIPVVAELEEEKDYEQLFQQTLSAGDRKLAARYLYIKTLQAMHRKGVVKLMKWKTVLEYTEELPSEKRPLFQKIGLLFESTWYGDYEPTEQDFEAGISSSNQLIN
ncbi:MAG: DUF4129 domain-containing protein [Cytophagales bacterium]|nr:DUF4129 domain-containing protein [Cytophagales bacterium]